MTGWSDVITAALNIIDDPNWRDELATNPAQFYRAKSQCVSLAYPMLSKPPELLHYIESGMSTPSYGDVVWVSTTESTQGQTVVPTGMTGFELCSVSVRSADGTEYFPYPNTTYDAETGNVTFPIQQSAGVEYSIDFYTDGQFADLSASQMRLMALAVAVVWDDRFQRDWLSNTLKLDDDSFKHANESNYMRQTNERYIANISSFNDELRDYEQLCAYSKAVGNYNSAYLR